MIEMYTLEEFLKAGLGFTDYFEETIFNYLINRDGYMYYDPVSRYMYDKDKNRIFYVEQEYKAGL